MSDPGGGQGFGGGEQGERLEGSLTDGGAVPGRDDEEARRFGAGKARAGEKLSGQPDAPPEGDDPTRENGGRPGAAAAIGRT